MRILFCNIAWMDYYKGKVDGSDEPQNGGSFVEKYKEAHEAYNFSPEYLDADTGYQRGEYCLGFVETKSTNGTTRNQLKIESIDGCEALKNEMKVEDVLVIYCALYPNSEKSETYLCVASTFCTTKIKYMESIQKIQRSVVWVWSSKCLVCYRSKRE